MKSSVQNTIKKICLNDLVEMSISDFIKTKVFKYACQFIFTGFRFWLTKCINLIIDENINLIKRIEHLEKTKKEINELLETIQDMIQAEETSKCIKDKLGSLACIVVHAENFLSLIN